MAQTAQILWRAKISTNQQTDMRVHREVTPPLIPVQVLLIEKREKLLSPTADENLKIQQPSEGSQV